MKTITKRLALLLFFALAFQSIEAQTPEGRNYTAVFTGFDWGPSLNKVILKSDAPLTTVAKEDFTVYVNRTSS